MEHLQERYQHLQQLHLDLEQRANQLQVCCLATTNAFIDVSPLQDRVNVSLSINDKIDDNIRQIKSKLILYETDLVRLKNEVANTVSEKRIRAETAVVRVALPFSLTSKPMVVIGRRFSTILNWCPL